MNQVRPHPQVGVGLANQQSHLSHWLVQSNHKQRRSFGNYKYTDAVLENIEFRRFRWPSALHVALHTSTLWLFVLSFSCCAAVCALFAVPLYVVESDLGKWDALNLSVQTLTTIGFGVVQPVTKWGYFIIAIESFIGLTLPVALASVIFLRMGIPVVHIQWSKYAILKRRKENTLMSLRLVNHGSELYDVHVRAFAFRWCFSPTSSVLSKTKKRGRRSFCCESVQLPLENAYYPVLSPNKDEQIYHLVNPTSVVGSHLKWDKGKGSLEALNGVDGHDYLSICVFLDGVDRSATNRVRSSCMYGIEDLVCNDAARWGPVRDGKSMTIDFRAFDAILKVQHVDPPLSKTESKTSKARAKLLNGLNGEAPALQPQTVEIEGSIKAELECKKRERKPNAERWKGFVGAFSSKSGQKMLTEYEEEEASDEKQATLSAAFIPDSRCSNSSTSSNTSSRSTASTASTGSGGGSRGRSSSQPTSAEAFAMGVRNETEQVIAAARSQAATLRKHKNDKPAAFKLLHKSRLPPGDHLMKRWFRLHWCWFGLSLLLVFMLLILCFALVLYLSEETVVPDSAPEAMKQGPLIGALFWSCQTLSTVGYGSVLPRTDQVWVNVLTGCEGICAMIFVAAVTGAWLNKLLVSTCRPEVVFSKNMILTTTADAVEHAGGRRDFHRSSKRLSPLDSSNISSLPMPLPQQVASSSSSTHTGACMHMQLIFRASASQARASLVNARFRLTVFMPTTLPDGSREECGHELKLQQDFQPILMLAGEVRHIVDCDSPLYPCSSIHDLKGLMAGGSRFYVCVSGTEQSTGATFWSKHQYALDDVQEGRSLRFADMLIVDTASQKTAKLISDFGKFNSIERRT